MCGGEGGVGLLRDDGERGSVLLQRQLRHLNAADEDGAAALRRRDKLCDRGEQARLARAGPPHDADLLARADG